MLTRVAKFFIVGVGGFVVQIASLTFLVNGAGCPWLPATVVAVECAIVHNYFWHRVWTWSDRSGSFLRFNASTAITSITGNVLLMALLVGAGLPVVGANVIAVGIMSAANFVIGDRWVFDRAPRYIAVGLFAGCVAAPAYAGPRPETLAAWNQYVAQFEAQAANASDGRSSPRTLQTEGKSVDVDSGTISHWRGSVLIPGVTLDTLLHRLQYPGTPPPQDDVTASRVLSRGPDSLHVYIRLVRHAIVTVTYDTEHEMTFRRLSPAVATARSIATRIDELGGGDKGFLWRLHSYWRYRQVDDGVIVSVESLTLSRDVPFIVRPIAGRIVPRIARESMVRTLEALRRYFS